MLNYCEHCPDKPTCKEICTKVHRYLKTQGIVSDGSITNSPKNDNLRELVASNTFPDELLGEDFMYCLDHMLSIKEKQVIEHLIEGYSDEQVYKLMKKVFPTYASYEVSKSRAKKKILSFLK